MATAPGSPSLDEFAKERGVHHASTSWMETLPDQVRTQCVDGWRSGLRGTVIAEWLVAEGYEEATEARVRNYCRRAVRG